MALELLRGGIIGSADGGHATLYPGPVSTRRDIFFVNGSLATATDAVTTHGRNRLRPLATLSYAGGTAAGEGDMIVVFATHRAAATPAAAAYDEALTVTISAAGVSIFGTGAGATRCTLISSSGPAFTFAGVGVELRNFILMDIADDGLNGWPVDVQAAGCVVGQCEFRQSNSARACSITSGSYQLIEDCTFKAMTDGRQYGLTIANGCNGIHVEGSTFDGNGYGWRAGSTANGALYLASGATSTGFYSVNCTLTVGADWSFEGTIRGVIGNLTMANGCRLISDVFEFYPAGYLAQSGGGNAALNYGFWITGDPYWVNNTSSAASNSNAGTNPELPLLTLAQALTNLTAANGDMILVAAGHNESVVGVVSGSVYTCSKADTLIFGFGSGVTRPQWTVTPAAAGSGSTTCFTCSAAGFQLHGFRFAASTYSQGQVTMLASTAAWFEVEGCSFTMGAQDATSISCGNTSGRYRLNNCDITVSAAGPVYGIQVTGTPGMHHSLINGCTLDNGASTRGWSQTGLSIGGSANNRCNVLTTTLRNGADIDFSLSYDSIIAGTIADAPASVAS